MSDELPGSLRSALVALTNWLNTANIPAIIIGGVAASVLGRPRLTKDVDALAILPESLWQAALTPLLGLTSFRVSKARWSSRDAVGFS